MLMAAISSIHLFPDGHLGPRGILIFCAERTPRQCLPGLIGDFKGIREDAALVPLLFVGLGLRLLDGDRSQWPTVGDVGHLAVCLSEYRSKRVFRHAVPLRFERTSHKPSGKEKARH